MLAEEKPLLQQLKLLLLPSSCIHMELAGVVI